LMVVVALWPNALQATLTRGVYTSLGCWKDTKKQVIKSLETTSATLKGDYRTRKDAVEKCFHVASKRGFRYFALQDGGRCASSMDAGQKYDKYGESNTCQLGKGGPSANDVYIINGLYSSLGCWKDTPKRAIVPLEGWRMKATIQQCYAFASRKGYRYFAFQDNGYCISSATAGTRYKMYGESKECRGGKGGPWANDVYIINGLYSSVGCWKDTKDNAIPVLEGTLKSLRGDYQKRKNAAQRCYKAASEMGYRFFALQDGGKCFAGAYGGVRYDMHGGSSKCREGKGGPQANDVYMIHGLYSSIGCWKDTANHAIPGIDGKPYGLRTNYHTRKDAIEKCYQAASRLGFKYFAIQDGGWCAATTRAKAKFRKYGASNKCLGGKGGPRANDVYIINAAYSSLGCWKDTAKRAIQVIEGTTAWLKGNYRHRMHAIRKCYRAARRKGFKVFAIQNGGQCLASNTAGKTYKKYGRSTACKRGKGGTLANNVYTINE